jgi:hypothetical protein
MVLLEREMDLHAVLPTSVLNHSLMGYQEVLSAQDLVNLDPVWIQSGYLA